MNIKDKITDWQEFYVNQCGSQKEAEEANKDLELVLFAIDRLTSLGGADKVTFSSDSREMLINNNENSGGYPNMDNSCTFDTSKDPRLNKESK